MHKIHLIEDKKLSKVKLIVRSISHEIEKGILKKDDKLPTINEFSEQYHVARDTIEKAYKELRKEGYIVSVPGNGYYVFGKKDQKIKVLLVFNKLSSYKKIIYESFIETLGDKGKVDLHVHHYSPNIFNEIITNHLGKYHYYVIMPHFFPGTKKEAYLSVINKIPPNELVLLDRSIPLKGEYISVYQDFQQDLYDALNSGMDLLKKYRQLILIFPERSNHPTDIKKGAAQFCEENHLSFTVRTGTADLEPEKGIAYIVITESDLASLIKKVRRSTFELGKDIGIISFNETVLKELLDITVVTTDFEEMGRTTAQLILDRDYRKIRNPFRLIRRHSL